MGCYAGHCFPRPAAGWGHHWVLQCLRWTGIRGAIGGYTAGEWGVVFRALLGDTLPVGVREISGCTADGRGGCHSGGLQGRSQTRDSWLCCSAAGAQHFHGNLEHCRTSTPAVVSGSASSNSVWQRQPGTPRHGVAGTIGRQDPVVEASGVETGTWVWGEVAGSEFLLFLVQRTAAPLPSNSCGVGSQPLWSLQSPPRAPVPGPLGQRRGWTLEGVSAFRETSPSHPVASLTR